MTFSDFIDVVEIAITFFGAVGVGLALYLFHAERRDRSLTIAENGRTGILSWALVFNESMRVTAMVALLIVGIVSLLTPNQTSPASLVGPLMPIMAVVFGALSVAQSTVLITARTRIARYRSPATPTGVAQQETLLEVQQDVAVVAEKVSEAHVVAGKVQERLAKLTDRADAAEAREHKP